MKKQTARIIVSVAGVATIVLMYVFFNQPQIILGIDIVLGALILLAARGRQYISCYAIAFIVLPIILDIPGTHLGLWSFGTPDFFGFPYWLPFFYGNLATSFLYVALTKQGRG